MNALIDVSAIEGNFLLFAYPTSYELVIGGLEITMTVDQFSQLCDNLRPWIVEEETPEAK